jgi:hypothetical protein
VIVLFVSSTFSTDRRRFTEYVIIRLSDSFCSPALLCSESSTEDASLLADGALLAQDANARDKINKTHCMEKNLRIYFSLSPIFQKRIPYISRFVNEEFQIILRNLNLLWDLSISQH